MALPPPVLVGKETRICQSTFISGHHPYLLAKPFYFSLLLWYFHPAFEEICIRRPGLSFMKPSPKVGFRRWAYTSCYAGSDGVRHDSTDYGFRLADRYICLHLSDSGFQFIRRLTPKVLLYAKPL